MTTVHEILSRLTPADKELAIEIVGGIGRLWNPDLVIAPDGNPYLLRWYLVPLTPQSRGLVMFHIQCASDPERRFHDHPWDNFSTILAGGYVEHIQHDPPDGPSYIVARNQGDVVFRHAATAHRLILPPDVPYTMTLFSTGPKVRSWGFWYGDTWRDHKAHVETRDGVSVHINRDSEPVPDWVPLNDII